MSKIKSAIALSDTHLGRDIGYLYSKDPDDHKFQKNRASLLDLLNRLGSQDELILNGDFLELSLAGLDEIYRDVKAFFTLLSDTGPYKRIVYIPGNHDHHFWRALAEQVHVNGKIGQGIDPPGHDKFPYCFVDERFSSQDPKLPCQIILADLWPKDKPAPEIIVKYPHHLARVALDNGSAQYYLFAHGHFLEDMFKPVNFLIKPAHLEELEAFNNLWLEAIDYHLGHSGRLSDRVRELVDDYKKGGKDAKREVKKLMELIYKNFKKKLKLKWPITCLLKWGLCWIVKKIPWEKKSGLFKAPIDEKLKGSIADYIEKYIVKRYRKGKAVDYHFPCDADIPTPFTFVFGHTHRPVRNKDEDEAKITVQGKMYPLVNTGGWLRTDGTKAANGENAGVLVIDQTGVKWESLEGKLE